MKFKVLVDNSMPPASADPAVDGSFSRQGNGPKLRSEHGLSFYFEADGLKWLLDVGASSLFADNARILGVDIAAVDHLILSHAHADHTGGLAEFLALNDHAQIWLSSHIDGRHFYSTRRGFRRDISIDYSLLESGRFHFVPANCELSPSVSLLTSIPQKYARPRADSTLYADAEKDDFNHEMAVLVKETSTMKENLPDDTGTPFHPGVTVLSSCSHQGILNTLLGAQEALSQLDLPIKAYVGGLHLVDSDDAHSFENADEIACLADAISTGYPQMTVYTGHCTGPAAMEILQQKLGDRLVHFYTGFVQQ